MTIAIASDHGGFELKEAIINHLISRKINIINLGVDSANSVDYPDYAKLVCASVLSGNAESGILVCGTGIGMSIAANKIDGIRCAHVTDTFSAEMAKKHNNANVIALGERITGVGLALKIVDAYLEAQFEGGRHTTRVEKIMELEK